MSEEHTWKDPDTGRWNWTIGRICWIDLETTGLWNPEDPPLPLEVAAVVTDRWLAPLGSFEAVIHHDRALLASKLDAWTREVHAKNGLLRLAAPRRGEPRGLTIRGAEEGLLGLLEETRFFDGAEDSRPILWGGSSPHSLDRGVVRHYMPEFYGKLHHRNLDVSTMILAAVIWGPSQIDWLKEDSSHRAMEDTEDAVDVAKRFAALLGTQRAQNLSYIAK